MFGCNGSVECEAISEWWLNNQWWNGDLGESGGLGQGRKGATMGVGGGEIFGYSWSGYTHSQ